MGLRFAPGADIPFGETTTYFDPGILGEFSFLFTPEAVSPFYFSGSLGYTRNNRQEDQYLSKIAFSGGGGIRYYLTPRFSLIAGVEGGYSLCMLDSDPDTVYSGIPVVKAAAGPSMDLGPSLTVELLGSWQGFLGLTNSLGASLGVTYKIKDRDLMQGPPVLKGLPPKIINIEFDEIFPVFYKYYDDHPAGSAIIINPREEEVTDITLDFYVNQYMDTPKRCTVPETLGPGETVNAEIIALFNNSVLGITEGTKVAAELALSYKIDGVKYTDVISETMRMQYRNAMTWDDDRRAAAFVTAKDPVIMGFAKNVASMLHEEESSAINKNLQTAIAIHDALNLYGMTYVIDPTTSYADLSLSDTAIDFLQFPRETLKYRAGDCDDLSILHCALFEAVGMESAFITVPGHIFMAFAPGLTPAEAARVFTNRDNLIIKDGKVWIPFEITAIRESFVKAWELGARQWNENEPQDKAGFFPVRKAWEHYEPVGLPGSGEEIVMPAMDKVVELFHSELAEFIAKEMGPQEERYKTEITRTQGQPKSYNKLGVLYARYGMNEEAEEQFEKALENEEYYPALLNLGNIKLIDDRPAQALEYYQRALTLEPENETVILAMARTSHSLGNTQSASDYYEKLKNISPELAERFSYLDSGKNEGERASSINASEGIVIWEEEAE